MSRQLLRYIHTLSLTKQHSLTHKPKYRNYDITVNIKMDIGRALSINELNYSHVKDFNINKHI